MDIIRKQSVRLFESPQYNYGWLYVAMNRNCDIFSFFLSWGVKKRSVVFTFAYSVSVQKLRSEKFMFEDLALYGALVCGIVCTRKHTHTHTHFTGSLSAVDQESPLSQTIAIGLRDPQVLKTMMKHSSSTPAGPNTADR